MVHTVNMGPAGPERPKQITTLCFKVSSASAFHPCPFFLLVLELALVKRYSKQHSQVKVESYRRIFNWSTAHSYTGVQRDGKHCKILLLYFKINI